MLASMRRRSLATLLAAAACTAALGAPPAAADRDPDRKKEEPADPSGRVAILQLRISGDAPAELRGQFEQSISRGLTRAKLQAVPMAEVRAALAGTELLDCTSSACLQQMADRVRATRFIRAGLEASGATYAVDLELIDARGGPGRRVGESCAVCTLTEVNALVERLAHDLVTGKDQPVEVYVVSRPEGAALTIDGRPVGPAPFTGRLAPGQHVVAALLAGHREAEKIITVHSGEAQRFEIILEAPRKDRPEPAPRRPFRTWKWVAAGGAGVALIGGAYLISIDGDQTCDQAPENECPERLSTLTGGMLTVGVGVAAGAASAWMFSRDRRDRRPQPRVSFVPGGVVGGVSWRF